jgi:hypothetical protein
MEVGAYLSFAVKNAFDKMASKTGDPAILAGLPDSAQKFAKKIISALEERHSNAPRYLEKISFSPKDVTVANLTAVLGDTFLGNRKQTKEGFEDFVKLFATVEGTKPTTTTKAPSTTPVNKGTDVRMDLSDAVWDALEKIDHKVTWEFFNYIESAKRTKGTNVLGIRYVDIDKDNPSALSVTFYDGKRQRMPVFDFMRKYVGPKVDNYLIDSFSKEFARIVGVMLHEPGKTIVTKDFEFNPKNVRETFLSMVTETYPKGHEDEVVKFLNPGLTKDRHGNYYKVIGSSDVMFTSHLDTVSTKSDVTLISRTKDGDEFLSSDGTTILGADDKAGVTVMLYMMAHNVPGVYYFFVGEESGGIGSGKVADDFRKTPHLQGIKKCVSFDRRNYYSVITMQMYESCCSDEFADALCAELNAQGFRMNPDPTGVFTDSANFLELIPECTNISVGYFNEHTKTESLNVSFLERLAKACVKVDWAGLPVARSAGVDESLYERWEEVISAMEETGFHNDIKLSGSRGSLVVKMSVMQSSFPELYTDLSNLEYIIEGLGFDAKFTFDVELIKIEIQ